ncbi:vitamin B12 dependent-methionine synthase activation domain-containing protein [Faecalicatena contorta]|uniref:Vitamin B12 dependent methionine synthase, activation domain n=1 Tax=Faecalicatena contorta TaxID=39482 RepID=A0A316A3Y3_9FIRM|nr:vitamin B12 dependent-methionine synthase activation domain-containing protein [Faecalicatena contorta]PWJ52229.1 cobalamin-dependent methionine synthase-like protein [Faecalicatena contorta]SUQ12507.1 Vitamin B12 dependent methionine synthase, activation domain [Faecalicatena contorta]
MDMLTKEAIRYLGYGKHAVDDSTLALISDSFRNLEAAAGRKSIYRIFDLEQIADDKFIIGKAEIQSRNLGRNLRGCSKIVLFGATLGTEVDRLITRTSLTDMAKAVIHQACAAAMLEEYCDECQRNIGRELEAEGLYLRPRFSPGYGDFDIRHQAVLMQMLDCAKHIGLTMTDSYMMTPTKSVTAVIGASATMEKCHIKGCESCGKKDCTYRRDTL